MQREQRADGREAVRGGTPLGPGSLHWKYAGDGRTWLMIGFAALQAMHPGLAAGVAQHSNFFAEPWERSIRSAPEIQGVTYDWPNAARTARKIREHHNEIKGHDQYGRRYHALDPGIFFWAHATIFEALRRSVHFFDHPLSEEENERFYAEARAHYSLYGLSERSVPVDWKDFERYFDNICLEVLEKTSVITQFEKWRHSAPPLPGIPKPVVRFFWPVLWRMVWWVAKGTLPPVVRDRFNLLWTAGHERRFRWFAGMVRRFWPLLPYRVRYSARARAGFQRVGYGPCSSRG
ncbi:oxygenase MpaB family protein [Streptomyces sp. NPDC056069]|uniref:oxygenase MpaB family protein n=1 Tax=Streptomyces sp. NPDC056069 TaxID=3345702 RepID=UPI0035E18B85